MKSVYVGNLPYATTTNELKALFEPYGTVYGARIKTDRDTGRPLGYGFVQMDDAAAAQAITGLNGKEVGKRVLRVNESRERPQPDRPGRRDFHSPRSGNPHGGERTGHRDFRNGGERTGHRDFRNGGERTGHRDFRNGGERTGRAFAPYRPPEDYEPETNDDTGCPIPREEFGGEPDPQRRREFRKNNPRARRDFRDRDRPRRPFIKTTPRKKGFRPNENYEDPEE